MPTLRKVSPSEAQRWDVSPTRPAVRRAVAALAPGQAQRLLGRLADRSGISRVDHRNTHGWLARVYPPGEPPRNRHFSDGPYGGAAEALQAAVAWRDAERATIPPPPPPAPRLWRCENSRQCGWLAQRPDRSKRYFADGAHGGTDAARATAWNWATQEVL